MPTFDRPDAHETTIAAVSMRGSHDVAANWARYEAFIEEATAQSVDYEVFPEISLQGYLFASGELGSKSMREQIAYFRETAETIPGPTTSRLQLLAQRHGMLIQAGMAERAMDGNIIYNSAVLMGSGSSASTASCTTSSSGRSSAPVTTCRSSRRRSARSAGSSATTSPSRR